MVGHIDFEKGALLSGLVQNGSDCALRLLEAAGQRDNPTPQPSGVIACEDRDRKICQEIRLLTMFFVIYSNNSL